MATVIGEMESTVDAGTAQAPATPETGGEKGSGKGLAREHLAGESRRISMRHERLKAD